MNLLSLEQPHIQPNHRFVSVLRVRVDLRGLNFRSPVWCTSARPRISDDISRSFLHKPEDLRVYLLVFAQKVDG